VSKNRKRIRGAPEPAANARALAWDILRRVEEGGAYADALLGHHLSTASGLDPRDQALVTRLVYGTLAWQGYLDHVLAAFLHSPVAELDAPVRTLLRLATFQICVLTRIPSFAAVDTAVELAKRFRGGAAAGLVNAVLRRTARGWQQVQLPSREHDPAAYLSTRLSHPRWLVERWLAAYGLEETEALLRANNEAAPTVLRTNCRRIEPTQLLARLREAGQAAALTLYSSVGIRLDASGPPEALPGYGEGLFSLQGEASQLVASLAGARPGDRVLDACAAPGGKATHLAEMMDDRGEIMAVDVNARGVERIVRTTQRLGLSIIRAVVADVTTWAPHQAPFDCALVDAPCSGLGTLREHPEVKWRRTPEDVASLAQLQLRLLRRVAGSVRPGGTLVYSTCTLSAEESEEVVAAFRPSRPEFTLDDPRPLLPAGARDLVGTDGALRTLPHRHGMDGFFAVRFKAAM
jgi:16S rRNA (cytosine967-C5)-methyltransferase